MSSEYESKPLTQKRVLPKRPNKFPTSKTYKNITQWKKINSFDQELNTKRLFDITVIKTIVAWIFPRKKKAPSREPITQPKMTNPKFELQRENHQQTLNPESGSTESPLRHISNAFGWPLAEVAEVS